MNNYAVIMAGGVGQRFWPKGTTKMPKQFLKIAHEKESMIQQTFRRLEGLINTTRIFVVTGQAHALGREPVDVRRLVVARSLHAQVGPTEIVGQNEDDIGYTGRTRFRASICGEQGKRHRRRDEYERNYGTR